MKKEGICPPEIIYEIDYSAPVLPYRNGSASFLLKNEIKGPIKKAVIIVPIPTTPGICLIVNPAERHRIVPASTQTRSPVILQMENGSLFCFSDQINVTAS